MTYADYIREGNAICDEMLINIGRQYEVNQLIEDTLDAHEATMAELHGNYRAMTDAEVLQEVR